MLPSSESGWLYALACVVMPVLWGLLMVAVVNAFERVARRRSPAQPDKSTVPLDESVSPEYHI